MQAWHQWYGDQQMCVPGIMAICQGSRAICPAFPCQTPIGALLGAFGLPLGMRSLHPHDLTQALSAEDALWPLVMSSTETSIIERYRSLIQKQLSSTAEATTNASPELLRPQENQKGLSMSLDRGCRSQVLDRVQSDPDPVQDSIVKVPFF